MSESSRSSLYETLYGNFTGGFDLHQVSEQNQVILSVLDNMQRILNSRAGALTHLPDYGLPDMTKILQGMPGTAHELMGALSAVLLKYEPRLKKITVVLLEQNVPGELRYAIDAELKGVGLVRYGTEFIQAQGRTSVLRVNYRNPCRILNFAYAFSRDYFDSHHNQELPLVLPEACGEEGDIPDIELCRSEAEEARRVVAWLKEQQAVAGRWGDMAVLCPTRYSADRLTVLLEQHKIPTAISFTSVDKKAYSHRDDVLHLMTFQSSKGLEFPYVAVINASFVHKAAEDESEAIPALYVAFTRATRSLLVTCHKENSISRQLTKFAGVDLQGQQDD